ncbi:hypothetical protein GCM10011409_11850 [Lentibacillus populi]|uniref:SAP domain-containing protein n=1 Tax=Lentibacillus populi TaxID=1827502 RepID=A0A9W5X4J2_9BACI|nr:SAP domain-containing protein [Lentibacillus populi]MBT2217636.1 hypothetical protein [Virgibacillus dakarensis]GGB36061.1 hypothetical protein GCM10011409_11850 [Lentibacillus populi]
MRQFHPDMTIKEFEQHYWYKEDLKRICREHNLSSHGIKAELEDRIKGFLQGEIVPDKRKQSSGQRKRKSPAEISLDTKLIPDGFKFNQRARGFFKAYYKVSKFSFTKEMASALRDAERRSDQDMTVADLIAIYENGKRIRTTSPEDRTYQWNNFVRDFNSDDRTKGMKNKMKVAAYLWKQVKNNPGSKEYNGELLDKFGNELKK